MYIYVHTHVCMIACLSQSGDRRCVCMYMYVHTNVCILSCLSQGDHEEASETSQVHHIYSNVG